ncbi:CC_3452 family protein [Hyphomonas sp.]|uniref:CC_3452 family protein n=1 Tax=Hyphomonas sp. TaxID=87 RepID=UPI00391BCEF3
MLRSAIAVMFMAGLSLPALASNAYTFETAEPVNKRRVVAESVVWTCEGTVCRGELARRAPTVRICKKIAREVGVVTSLRNTNAELTEAELAECNTAVRR